jgi:hypothetical protein
MLATAAMIVALYSEVSVQGESMDQFVYRIAPRAIAETARLRSEVCGAIEGNPDDGFTITIHTTNKKFFCTFPNPDAGISFHTHIYGNPFFSALDYSRPGYMAIGGSVWFQHGRGTDRRLRDQ